MATLHIKAWFFPVLTVSLAGIAAVAPAQEPKKEERREERQVERRESRPEERRARPEEGRGSRNPETRESRPAGPQNVPREVRPNEAPRGPAGVRPENAGRTFGNRPAAAPAAAAPHREGPPVTNNRPAVRPGSRVVTTGRGDVIRRNTAGRVTQVRLNNGTVVYHPPSGPRRVTVVRPGGRVIVASAPGHGYVQRQIVVRNTTVIKRTYVFNGVPQARIYRPVVFGGITLAVYTPVHYFRPPFYVWMFNPWPRPIVYTWGWGPWYAYYGPYFTPYPAYASPSLWLTDYLIASTLEAAYQDRMAAQAAAQANAYPNSAPLTPEVKQAISDEVRRQIDYEKAQGQNGWSGSASSIFTDNQPHIFVVHNALNVSSNYGECAITEGDVLQMNSPPPPNATAADLIVLASRGGDCHKASTVYVGLSDLQEMNNQMRATIDRGMNDLQARQGQNGLPPLPQNAAGALDTPYAQDAQPDPNASQDIATASVEADQAEQQALAAQSPAAGGNPPTLTTGLTVDQVVAIQGQPQKVVDLGAKKTYLYKDMKITFTDGRVTDISVQ